MGFQFPDAAMSGKPMKASYINDLRDKINEARDDIGQSPINWGPDLTRDDVIRASHMNDIRDAIRNLWLTKDLIDNASEFPGYANGQPATLTAFKAGQTSDNRLWLNQAQNYPTRQGLNSLIHDPGAGQGISQIGTPWKSDINSLASAEHKRVVAVRSLIKKGGTEQNPHVVVSNADIDRCAADFNLYSSTSEDLPSLAGYAILNRETYSKPASQDPIDSQNEYLRTMTIGADTIHNTNPYIEEFAQNISPVIERFVTQSSVRDFIIWNEPNDINQPSKYMTADKFAALLRRVWMRTRAILQYQMDTAQVKLYWGGILLGGTKSTINDDDFTYIRSVYSSIESQKDIVTGGNDYHEDYGRTWPWHGINIQPHHERDDLFAEAVNAELDSLATRYTGDTNELILGEWGIQLEGDDCTSWASTPTSKIAETMSALKKIKGCQVMFYFSHSLSIDTAHTPPSPWGLRRYFFGGTVMSPCPNGLSTECGAPPPPGGGPSPCPERLGRLGGTFQNGGAWQAYSNALNAQ